MINYLRCDNKLRECRTQKQRKTATNKINAPPLPQRSLVQPVTGDSKHINLLKSGRTNNNLVFPFFYYLNLSLLPSYIFSVAQQVDQLAAGFIAAGMKKGDHLGIWGPNMREWVLTQFAAARVGLILVR